MFKRENASEEVYNLMKCNLRKSEIEQKFKFNKIAQVIDLLGSTSILLEQQDLIEESNDVLNLIESLSK